MQMLSYVDYWSEIHWYRSLVKLFIKRKTKKNIMNPWPKPILRYKRQDMFYSHFRNTFFFHQCCVKRFFINLLKIFVAEFLIKLPVFIDFMHELSFLFSGMNSLISLLHLYLKKMLLSLIYIPSLTSFYISYPFFHIHHGWIILTEVNSPFCCDLFIYCKEHIWFYYSLW